MCHNSPLKQFLLRLTKYEGNVFQDSLNSLRITVYTFSRTNNLLLRYNSPFQLHCTADSIYIPLGLFCMFRPSTGVMYPVNRAVIAVIVIQETSTL